MLAYSTRLPGTCCVTRGKVGILRLKPVLIICIGHVLLIILGFYFLYVKYMGGLEVISALLYMERPLKP